LLEDDAPTGDVLHVLAEQLAAASPAPANDTRRARRAGLGGSVRDELAAAVGRRFPRWPTEVRRLVAMAARLDPTQLDSVAERLAADAARIAPDHAVSETVALRVVQGEWGLTRLGLAPHDRDVLRRLMDGDKVAAADPAVSFLQALGLIASEKKHIRLTKRGEQLGPEALQ
jgi:hypothetical protein